MLGARGRSVAGTGRGNLCDVHHYASEDGCRRPALERHTPQSNERRRVRTMNRGGRSAHAVFVGGGGVVWCGSRTRTSTLPIKSRLLYSCPSRSSGGGFGPLALLGTPLKVAPTDTWNSRSKSAALAALKNTPSCVSPTTRVGAEAPTRLQRRHRRRAARHSDNEAELSAARLRYHASRDRERARVRIGLKRGAIGHLSDTASVQSASTASA